MEELVMCISCVCRQIMNVQSDDMKEIYKNSGGERGNVNVIKIVISGEDLAAMNKERVFECIFFKGVGTTIK